MTKIKVSDEVQEDALLIAKKTHKAGQTKEQTKLIAQGIQKGIAEYKKSIKKKQRQADKYNKKMKKEPQYKHVETTGENIQCKTKVAPWVLLGISWLSFIVYFVFKA